MQRPHKQFHHRALIISIRTQSTNVDRFPHANHLDPAPIAQIDKASGARPRGPTRRGGLLPGLVAVLSAVVALPPRRAHRQPRPPRRLPPPPRRPHSQRADTGGQRGPRRRLGMPRREARPTGLQVEGPHARGCVEAGGWDTGTASGLRKFGSGVEIDTQALGPYVVNRLCYSN